MVRCPLCQKPLPAQATSCPTCGDDDAATRHLQNPSLRPVNFSSDSLDNARFVPGTMLVGRYRIVGLIGKGGMGEVYRAEDLKSSSSVCWPRFSAHVFPHVLSLNHEFFRLVYRERDSPIAFDTEYCSIWVLHFTGRR